MRTRCLETFRASGVEGFDLACAYEAIARASTVAGRDEDAAMYAELARGLGERIGDDEDRQILLADLASLPV